MRTRQREKTYLVFGAASDEVRIDARDGAPDGYRFVIWEPTPFRPRPSLTVPPRYAVWWLFHQLRVFSNRDYAILIGLSGDDVVFTMGIFPPWFRFPFMRVNDIQLGDLWTRPEHRGKSLATAAIRHALRHKARSGRRFWYLCAEDNLPSIRAAERAGLARLGEATRTARGGLSVFGSFVMTRP